MLNIYFRAKREFKQVLGRSQSRLVLLRDSQLSFDFNFAESRFVGLIFKKKIIFAKVPHWGLPQNLAHYPLPTMWRLRRQVWDFRRKLCNAIG